MQKIKNRLKEWQAKHKRKKELRVKDQMWDMFFGYCFDAFPPSVRETLGPEEIAIRAKALKCDLQSMISGYAQENGVSAK